MNYLKTSGHGYMHNPKDPGTKESHDQKIEFNGNTYYHKEVKNVTGRISRVHIHNSDYGDFLNVTCGDNVIQCKLEKSDDYTDGNRYTPQTIAMIKSLYGFDFNSDVNISCGLKEWETKEGEKRKTFTFWIKKTSGEWANTMLTDIPKYKKVKKRGKSLNNYEERDNFYFETLNSIIEKCSSQKVETKELVTDNPSEDLPF